MTMNTEQLLNFTLEKLDDIKANNVVVLDVRGQTPMTDYMVIAEGTSTQHVRSLASHLRTEAKGTGQQVFGFEGEDKSNWILVDLGDVIAHVMMPETRAYYELEKLWSVEEPIEQVCG